jgi:hypothetical protein
MVCVTPPVEVSPKEARHTSIQTHALWNGIIISNDSWRPPLKIPCKCSNKLRKKPFGICRSMIFFLTIMYSCSSSHEKRTSNSGYACASGTTNSQWTYWPFPLPRYPNANLWYLQAFCNWSAQAQILFKTARVSPRAAVPAGRVDEASSTDAFLGRHTWCLWLSVWRG